MKRIGLLVILLFPMPALAQDHAAHSSYAGFETREIKTLSDADLDDLRCGLGACLVRRIEQRARSGVSTGV